VASQLVIAFPGRTGLLDARNRRLDPFRFEAADRATVNKTRAVRRSSKIAAFMTSFSTHAGDGDFERQNGLWSQWERYAGPDGFCIVFDTAAMGDLLAKEFDSAYWVRLALNPVRYSGADVPIDRLMPELINAGEDVFRQFMRGEELQEFAVPEFLMGATLLKDAAYREEREVRIVAIPGTKKLMARGLRIHPDRFKRQACRGGAGIRADQP
jgi:hypothetical protein